MKGTRNLATLQQCADTTLPCLSDLPWADQVELTDQIIEFTAEQICNDLFTDADAEFFSDQTVDLDALITGDADDVF